MLPPHLPHRVQISFVMRSVHYRAVLDARCDPPLWVVDDKGHLYDSPAKREWGPWKLLVGDVDGDGNVDLLIGVVKSTHQLHFPHTCLFVYSFDGKKVTRKWLGSTMGRPLVDFALCRADSLGWQQLFTLETTLDGRTALSRYRWRVFGFHRNSGQAYWHRASHLVSHSGRIEFSGDGKRTSIDPSHWN